jgi:hypothetical protein
MEADVLGLIDGSDHSRSSFGRFPCLGGIHAHACCPLPPSARSIGHGGNSGSQTVSSVIRAVSLKQIRWRHVASVMLKEAAAGAITGACLLCIVR